MKNYDYMDVQLDPECTGWMTGKMLSEKSEHKGLIARGLYHGKENIELLQ